MTAPEATRLMQYLLAVWNVELDEMQLAVWAETFADLNFETARRALQRLKSESQWLPSHAAVIAACQPPPAPFYKPFVLPPPSGPRLPLEESHARFERMRALINRNTNQGESK